MSESTFWDHARAYVAIAPSPPGLSGPCWLWTAGLMPNGYARLSINGVRDYAHRMAYRECVGPLQTELKVDHLCRRRHCVQPRHLEMVTHAENVRRGAKGRLVTICANNHRYTPESTYFAPNGTRKCRICRAAARERSRLRAMSRA